ncbi:MAG TPA: formylglycine-generating enzyme family protein [Roseiflexaceae bacterium]|nr:formylglycine-generating enzyme family protein [Roseiflexaceae bacterium]
MTQPYNPFTRSNALRLDHPLFKGRAVELARLERACLSDHGLFMLVYGGRQNGKTTLLLRLEERLRGHTDAGVRVCRVDFQGAPRATSHDAYRLLAHRVAQVLPQVKSLPDTLDAPALADFLESALAESGVRRLALLLDELGSLPDATRVDLAHVLRGLHTRQRDSAPLSKLQVALFGGIELYDLAVVQASALHNVCETVALTDLSEAEAVALVADGLGLVGVEADRAAVLGRAVYARVGGHPYLTQRLGELLAEWVLAGKQPDEAAVDALAWALLQQRDPLLEHLRRAVIDLRLEEAARRLLSACEHATRTAEATTRLELLGLARRAGRHWAPRCPLLAVALAEWLDVLGTAAAAPMPDVAVEVQRTAAVYLLHDLKDEHAAVTTRILTAATVEEQLRLQRRARELAIEIGRVERVQHANAAIPPALRKPGKPTREIFRVKEVKSVKSASADPPPKSVLIPTPASRRVLALPPWVPALVKVPAGPFLMGSADNDTMAYPQEKPQHRLELPDFWIGRTPVTNAQFRSFVEDDGYTNRAYWTTAGWLWREQEGITQPEYWTVSKWNGADYPVVGVSWFEAVAYCRWLGAQTGHPFRLPSEAEWEKAARGPDGQIWPWGNRWEAGRCNSREAGVNRTSPVGQYPSGASPYGALDMAGNVWEWCATQQRKNYPYPLEDEWTEAYLEANVTRIIHGGSWHNEQQHVRVAYRHVNLSPDRFNYRGLRVARYSPRPDSES